MDKYLEKDTQVQKFPEFLNINLMLLLQICITPWLEHSMLDLH